jgi:ferredoxin-NADP reductase
MAERKTGTVSYWKNLSPDLAIFRLMPENGSRFPRYQAGQYVALCRDDCRLTTRVKMQDGRTQILPDVDEHGNRRIGPVVHSYSVSSAPYETEEKGYLEFYVTLERAEDGRPGRLTESFFRMNPGVDDRIIYVNRITGDFTLEKRAAGFSSVLLIGIGTGLAPFFSMIKQVHHEASGGRTDSMRYTLLYTNRTFQELAYHQELLEIETSKKIDFVYIPSVSRPDARDQRDPAMSQGRANNLLRRILGLPMREEQDLEQARAEGVEIGEAEAALHRAVRPVLSTRFVAEQLSERFNPRETVILTCGNPFGMADIRQAADACKIHFEKEDW